MKVLINIAGFYAAWFALVGGAAAGEVWCGVGVLFGVVCIHLLVSRQHAVDEFALLAMVAWVGYIADSVLILLGVLLFPPQAQVGWPAPVWMTGLWVNFAVTLNGSFRWAGASPRLAAVFGAAGGPLSYYAGARMGALGFGTPLPIALAIVGLQWVLMTPALAALARWVRSGPDTVPETPKGARP